MKTSIWMAAMVLTVSAGWAAETWKAPASAKALKNPIARAEGARLGQALFEENCVLCHGKAGKGDGAAAAGMNPKPKSLVDRTVQAQTDGELFWKITEGRDAMPSWKGLSEKERWSLVHRLRTLAEKK